jgi:hypothetical protein
MPAATRKKYGINLGSKAHISEHNKKIILDLFTMTLLLRDEVY